MSELANKELRITTRDDARSIFELEGVQYSETGLTLPDDLPYEVWEEMMGALGKIGRGIQWAIGDAINYGDRAYGEMYSQAIEATGYNYNTLANFAWVARVFPPDRRRKKLYFDHHSSVAWLYQQNEDVANEILDLAEGPPKLSVKEVRNDVREAENELGLKRPSIPPGLETHGHRRSGDIVVTEEGEFKDLGPIPHGPGWHDDYDSDEDDGARDLVVKKDVTPKAEPKAQGPDHPMADDLKGLDEMMDELLDIVIRVAVARPPELLNLQQEAITWIHNHGLAGELHSRRE